MYIATKEELLLEITWEVQLFLRNNHWISTQWIIYNYLKSKNRNSTYLNKKPRSKQPKLQNLKISKYRYGNCGSTHISDTLTIHSFLHNCLHVKIV